MVFDDNGKELLIYTSSSNIIIDLGLCFWLLNEYKWNIHFPLFLSSGTYSSLLEQQASCKLHQLWMRFGALHVAYRQFIKTREKKKEKKEKSQTR